MILDTNGWYFTKKKQWFAEQGGYKVQISLDSFVEAEHDEFRRKPGAYKRALRAFKAKRSRSGTTVVYMPCERQGFSKEFEDMMKYCRDEDIPLYVH